MSLQDDGKKVIGNLRSRLSFRSRQRADDYDDYDDYDENYEEDYAEYNEYDEYNDYAVDDGYDDGNASYDNYAPATPRSAGGRRNTPPRLVSLQDVRENVRESSVLPNDSYYDSPSRYASSDEEDFTSESQRSFGRTMVDSSLPPQMTPEGTADAAAAASRRSANGLDSLFSSTVEPAEYVQDEETYNDFSDYEEPLPVDSYAPQRGVTVLKLVSYNEAESVVKALQRGNVAVLQLRNTPEKVFTRILDFAFGAACALGASVECIGEKTFAISCTDALSDAERTELHNRGII